MTQEADDLGPIDPDDPESPEDLDPENLDPEDRLDKYQREFEGDDDEEVPFEDQVFCSGMINDAEDFDLKVKTFPAEISDDDLNAWLQEKRGKNVISRSIKARDYFGRWMRIWYYEST